jgi:hypothetical protein
MVLDWLAEIRRNKGVDVDDLGLIRFHLLLKVFALQEEERLLLKVHQLPYRIDSNRILQYSPRCFFVVFSKQPSLEIKSDNPTHLAELKDSFGMYPFNNLSFLYNIIQQT